MKVTLIYPPDHRIPHSLYLALPELAGCLQRAGHEVILRDLNAEVLNLLLDKTLLQGYHDYMQSALKLYEVKPELNPAEQIERDLIHRCYEVPLDRALAGEDAVKTLYNEDTFYKPECYRDALDKLEATLPFLFGSIVGLSPFMPRYLQQVEQILHNLQDDPITHTLRSGLIESLLADEPDLIGMTIPYQECIMEAFRIAALIRREAPDMPIAIGGPQVTKYREQFFADNTLFSFLDFAVVYEGTQAVVEIVEAMEKKRSFGEVRNLYWSDKGRVIFNGVGEPEDMNALPTPSYDGFANNLYLKPEPVHALMTTRGCCWKRCVFCSEAFHSRFAMRSPKKVFEDVKTLVEKYGTRFIYFWDSLMPPRTMRELSEMIVAEGIEVYWFADSKFYNPFSRPDFVSLIHKAGLRCLQFGLESASQRILKLMRKGTKIEKVPEILRLLHDQGIMNQISWFTGFPSETTEEFKETLTFLEKHRNHIDLSVFVGSFYFEFGTYLSEHPEEFDSEIVDVGGDYHLKPRSGMDPEEVERYKEHYLKTSDMDLLCHGGYMLYHANRGLSPKLISKTKGFSILDTGRE